jgi:uncharacterized membrane protein YjjB (DUF3815 family)
LANVSVSVAASCLTYILLLGASEHILGISEVHRAGYICSMLFIIPGFPLITGGMDIAKLELRSGIERLVYAFLIIAMATITGWIVAYTLGYSPSDFTDLELNTPLTIIFRMITSFAGVYGFSYLFNSKRKMALIAGLIGMIANTLRLELIDFTNIPVSIAAFIGAMTAGLLASAARAWIGYPRISVTVPSIVIMVPGMFFYKGIYFMAQNDISSGMVWLTKAVLIAFALPLGLIFARVLTDNNFRKSS